MFTVTLKNILAHRRRLMATVIAIVLGVGFMTGTLVLTDTIGRTFDRLFADANDGVDAYVRAESAIDADPLMGSTRPRLDLATEQRAAEIDGVRATAPQIQGYAEIVHDAAAANGQRPHLGGNWIEVPELNPFQLDGGRGPRRSGEVAIDRGTAEELGLSIGDSVAVATKRGVADVVVVGIARFGAADRPGSASYVFFDGVTAQELIAEPGRIDGVRIAAEAGVEQAELVASLDSLAGDGVEVLTGAQLTAEDQDSIAEQLRFFNTFLLTFAVIALVVGSFIIANTFSMLVAQRTRETALLRAIGANRRQVLVASIGEAAIVGIGASLAGVGAGVGLAAALKALLAVAGVDIPADGLVITPRTVVAGLVIGTMVTTAAALLPARQAARLAPVTAMRPGTTTERARRVRPIAGAAAAIAGAVLVVSGLARDSGVAPVAVGIALAFGGAIAAAPAITAPIVRTLGAPLARRRSVAGTLARDNAMRNPHRTAATASALTIGVALVATMTVLGASANASIDEAVADGLRADIVVDTGMFATTGLSPNLAANIADVAGAITTTTTRTAPATVDGHTIRINAVDPDLYPQVVEVGDILGTLGDLTGASIAVQRDLATEHGWAVGDSVTVRFAETGEHRFTVVATYEHGTLAGDYLIHHQTFERHVADQVDSQIYVVADPDADVAAVREAVAATTAGYPNARVQDRDEFVGNLTGHIDEMLNLVTALLVLAVVIALIGIANTLSLAIVERTRELGLLRAVGMTRRQMRATVRIEALLVSALGAAIGLTTGTAAGSALAASLADQGIDHLAIPTGRLAITALVAAGAGVLAAVGPARRAARLDVLDAIATA
jgi:putative ABC transport system permease protein